MTPQQTFENYPVFGDNASKIKPDDAKYAAGFQQADVLPAEWMNWAWYKNTKGITDLNLGVESIEKELINILVAAGITPALATENQVVTAVQSLIEAKTGSLSSLKTTAKTTLVAAINENYDNNATNVNAISTEVTRATGVESALNSNKNDKITISDNSAALDDNSTFLSGSSGINPTAIARHAFSKVWNYINSKISSVLGLNASTYGGKAASAGSADSAGTAGRADQSAHLFIDGTTWDSNWRWSGNAGQPSWLWGSNNGTDMSIWDPSNFNVAHASTADSAGTATSANSASNAGALEGKSWRETALSGLYVGDNTTALSGSSYTFSPTAPVGSAALAVGSTVKITFANALQSSTAITSVNLNYGGCNGQIVAARQNTLVGVVSHLFQGGEYSAQYPNKVWDAYTTLELMWTGTYWLVMGDAVLCSYFSSDANYVIKSNGFITQWGRQITNSAYAITITFPSIFMQIPSFSVTSNTSVSSSGSSQGFWTESYCMDKTTAMIYCRGTGSGVQATISWFAIGY